ncbi:MAG: hypothetical protein K0S85_91 [Pseudomonas orientalis]|nr:hypothetical protein [Pseudomonas orientalis]
MKAPIYCRTSGQRIGGCFCYRCRPVEQEPKPVQAIGI